MKVALAFNRPDVDELLEELSAEQFREWNDYFALRPVGFDALNIVATHLAFWTAQSHSTKKLDARDFRIVMKADRVVSAQTERLQWEANQIRAQIAAEIDGED